MRTNICQILREQNSHSKANLDCASAIVLCLGLCAMPAAQSLAQVFPPQGDDTTPSMGVFRIIVDPLFRPLLGPVHGEIVIEDRRCGAPQLRIRHAQRRPTQGRNNSRQLA
jgi:hypothetical protein